MCVKDQFLSLFKTKKLTKPVKIVHGSGKKPRKLKTQKKSEGIIKNIIKNIKNLFKLKKESKTIKDRTVTDIKTLFEQQEKDYYQPVRVGSFWNNNYIKY